MVTERLSPPQMQGQDENVVALAVVGRELLADVLQRSWSPIAEEWRTLLMTEGLPYQRRRATDETRQVLSSFERIAALMALSLGSNNESATAGRTGLLSLYRQYGRDWASKHHAEPELVVLSPRITRAIEEVLMRDHASNLSPSEVISAVNTLHAFALDLALARVEGYLECKASRISELELVASSTRFLDQTSDLTSREMEVLAEIATGATTKQIASHLFLSEHTVKRHTSNIYQKLNVTHRSEAAVEAVRLGLLRPMA